MLAKKQRRPANGTQCFVPDPGNPPFGCNCWFQHPAIRAGWRDCIRGWFSSQFCSFRLRMLTASLFVLIDSFSQLRSILSMQATASRIVPDNSIVRSTTLSSETCNPTVKTSFVGLSLRTVRDLTTRIRRPHISAGEKQLESRNIRHGIKVAKDLDPRKLL